MSFQEEYAKFMQSFGKAKTMVLSTALEDKVSSRMMSIIRINDKFYFQTDKNFRKYKQIKENPNVAVCIDNMQIEGHCKEIGRPMDYTEFDNLYREYFYNSHERYSALDKERLFEITPVFIERWLYIDGIPYMEVFDVNKGRYQLIQYT